MLQCCEPEWLEAVGDQSHVHQVLRERLEGRDLQQLSIAVEGYKDDPEALVRLARDTLLGFNLHGAGWRVGSLRDLEDSHNTINDILNYQGVFAAYKEFQIANLGAELQDRIFLAVERFQPIVIHGPSGTGKSRLARHLHRLRFRSNDRCIERNLANIDLGTFENALCGHVKGGYTGADEEANGAFHVADGGTLFLDEFAETNLDVQTKLLKYLNDANEDGSVSFTKVGGTDVEQSYVWFLCATNKHLQQAIQKGELRADIMQRFAVQLELPGFKQKCETHLEQGTLRTYLVQLIREHVAQLCSITGWMFPSWLPDEVYRVGKKLFLDYTWPGNDRQFRRVLQNFLYRQVASDGRMERTTVDLEDVVASLHDERQNWGTSTEAKLGLTSRFELFPETKQASLLDRLQHIKLREHQVMEQAFDKYGNYNAAAKALQMNRQKFISRLEKFREEAAELLVAGGPHE